MGYAHIERKNIILWDESVQQEVNDVERNLKTCALMKSNKKFSSLEKCLCEKKSF